MKEESGKNSLSNDIHILILYYGKLNLVITQVESLLLYRSLLKEDSFLLDFQGVEMNDLYRILCSTKDNLNSFIQEKIDENSDYFSRRMKNDNRIENLYIRERGVMKDIADIINNCFIPFQYFTNSDLSVYRVSTELESLKLYLNKQLENFDIKD